MPRLVLSVLGGFRASLGSGASLAVPTRKGRALLAYLALTGGRAHTRDALAALLWGDCAAVQARKSLRQALYALRGALRAAAASLRPVEGEGLALDPLAVEVDAVRFERLATEGTPEALDRAAALYRGELLHGLDVDEAGFEEWLRLCAELLRRSSPSRPGGGWRDRFPGRSSTPFPVAATCRPSTAPAEVARLVHAFLREPAAG